jgi:tetratricopeptide (TPR) repeat protein
LVAAMNRNDFLNMIEDTIPVSQHLLGEVYELIAIFPYFQSAHLLLLKGLQNNADVKFENQLRNSAIHIANRETLYYHLMKRPSPEVVSGMANTDKAYIGNQDYDNQQTVIETAKNSESLINEIEKNSGETRYQEQDDTVQQVPVHTILISNESDNEESAGVMLLEDEEAIPIEDQIFYMDPGISVPDNSGLLELEPDDDNTVYAEESGISRNQMNDERSDSKKQMQSELIDKFIIANPRIEPLREKTNFQLEDISKPFIEEEGCFVTETLAKIYINQGYYSKAIDIYEKLSLKFPEKSSYFASQIEKVKEYIKK